MSQERRKSAVPVIVGTIMLGLAIFGIAISVTTAGVLICMLLGVLGAVTIFVGLKRKTEIGS